MPLINSPTTDQASIYTDLNSLDHIRRQGQVDELGAIKKAAQEFEAFFMNMMLKSMREASEVIGSDSPFSSQQEKMYVGMLDEQMSVNLSQQGHLRIADLMVEQLARSNNKVLNSDDLSVHLAKIKSPDAKASAVQKGQSDISLATSAVLADKTPQKPANESLVDESKFDKKVTDIVAHIQQAEKRVLQAEMQLKQSEAKATEKVAPTKQPVFEQISDFISELLPLAKKAAAKLSLDPRLLIAQAALETGWGKFVIHDEKGQPGFNLFGIKAGNDWQGEHIKVDTLEVDGEQVHKVNASFRKYQNFAESFEDYVDFVTSNPRYQNAVKVASKAEAYLNELQQSGYATDPNYAQKILQIFTDQKLQSFEPSSEGNGNTSR